MAEEATKLFRFIDNQMTGLISKQKLKQMISYFREKQSTFTAPQKNDISVLQKLVTLSQMSKVKEISEQAFVYFFCQHKVFERMKLQKKDT